MITQYVRILTNSVDGSVVYCTSQDFPFADGWEPIEDPAITVNAYDFEIDADYPDADFGIGVNQQIIRGRQILENFEILGGQPQLKAGADVAVFSKVMRVSVTKSIEETAIKVELATAIKTGLESGGSTEKELLDDMRLTDKLTPIKLEDLKTIQLIRLKKSLYNFKT